MSLIWWKVWKLRTEEVELTHILVALCNASQIHSAALEYLHNFSSQFEMTFQYYGGKWLITKGACRDQVWNACHGAVDRKVICYASPLFTCVVYHPHICRASDSYLPRARDGVIQLGNPTRISRSVVTKCQCSIFCFFIFFNLVVPGSLLSERETNLIMKRQSIETNYESLITIWFHWNSFGLYINC